MESFTIKFCLIRHDATIVHTWHGLALTLCLIRSFTFVVRTQYYVNTRIQDDLLDDHPVYSIEPAWMILVCSKSPNAAIGDGLSYFVVEVKIRTPCPIRALTWKHLHHNHRSFFPTRGVLTHPARSGRVSGLIAPFLTTCLTIEMEFFCGFLNDYRASIFQQYRRW